MAFPESRKAPDVFSTLRLKPRPPAKVAVPGADDGRRAGPPIAARPQVRIPAPTGYLGVSVPYSTLRESVDDRYGRFVRDR